MCVRVYVAKWHDRENFSAFFKEFSLGGGGKTGKKGRTKNMRSRRGLANARVSREIF